MSIRVILPTSGVMKGEGGGAPLARALGLDIPSLDAAVERIARSLVREAMWDGDRCNWANESWNDGSVDRVAAYNWIPRPALYSGSPGIGLFLAEAYSHGGRSDSWILNAARGAFRHATDVVRRRDEGHAPGFYEGAAGIAFALLHAGLRAGVAEWVEAGGSLAIQVARDCAPGECCDIVAGMAGTVVGLLAAYDVLGQQELLVAAERQARIIADRADRSGVGWSWRAEQASARDNNLTGMSHGAAGAGWAFAEVYRRTGDALFLEGVIKARAYEASVMDVESGNWPDYRPALGEPEEASDRAQPPRFQRAWCHGAPGIAIARARAWLITRDVRLRDDALLALRTTGAALPAVPHLAADYGLCHGVLGLVECLLYGRYSMGVTDFDHRIGEAVGMALDAFGTRDSPWPCGSSKGATIRGMMSGVAGIGYVLLRMASANAPLSMIMPFASIDDVSQINRTTR